MKRWTVLSAIVVCLAVPASETRAAALARKILVLYDSTYDKETTFMPVHQIAEMPLNHLGLIAEYRDINRDLPQLNEMQDVRGILTWFRSDAMVDPNGFLAWAEMVIGAGKKFVVIGDLSVRRDFHNRLTPLSSINRFWSQLGLKSEDDWQHITYDWAIQYKDPAMVEYERAAFGVLPHFQRMKKIDSRAKSYLVIRRGNDPSTGIHLVVVNQHGGYVAGGYMHFSTTESHGRLWYVNPFEFFRVAFGTDDLPKPDTTTLSGRRIFYSHVDGDGWRNVTEIMPYKKDRMLTPEVLLREVVDAFPDLPLTVAPIAGDLDPAWHGTRESLQVAREIFARANVEAGTHTYAHPLDWSAFEPGRLSSSRTPIKSASMVTLLARLFDLSPRPLSDAAGAASRYEQPITYADKPFDLRREIRGSVEVINRLLPQGKKVEVVQWSGDTLPFEAAVAETRAAGLRNLNGGDTRFDREYQSYGWVSPLGRQIGSQRQIYASNSNENTYTDLWSDRFFGFRYLIRTIQNTETPARIKPFNIYYHMYSGEKFSSLKAVIENYRYARTQEIAPITASNYAAIADGFFTAEIEPLGDRQWRITNRQSLQTVRFDNATLRAVDFTRSSGVLGHRHHQGSLYVSLDPADQAPVIALRALEKAGQIPAAETPYLVHGRWQLSDFAAGPATFKFDAHGFGGGELVFRVPMEGTYTIDVREASGARWVRRITAAADGLLRMNLGGNGLQGVHVEVRR